MTTLDEMIEVMQAFKRGEEIEAVVKLRLALSGWWRETRNGTTKRFKN